MNSSKPKGIIFTDFDGTLFDSNRIIVPENYAALEKAGRQGYLRVIATGRSLFSFRRAAAGLERRIENYIDYLIFSSGAGTLRCLPGILEPEAELDEYSLIEAEALDGISAFTAADLLYHHGIDFMIHRKVPENHRFTHIKANGAVNPDYYRRIRIYSDYASLFKPSDNESDLEAIERICYQGVSQLVAVIPPEADRASDNYAAELLEYLRLKLPECSVIRTTSPIDHISLWIEVFNSDVSKSKASERLARRMGLCAADCLAIGNDFNDEDLLSWAGRGMTVSEAPEIMRAKYPSSGPAAEGAVSAAVIDFIR
ncbi:MAG: HAD family phosphatase [Spirochaetales bacterium]|nr:HAD family phosphatase [Spirochaetales bacterium]